jgi:hypothetical protein
MARPKRIATVTSVQKLEAGVTFELNEFQVSAATPDGTITMVNMDIREVGSNKNSGYTVKPGAWRVTPEDGLMHLDLPDETYYETKTAKDLLNHMNVFKNKLDVYKKYNLTPRRGILLGSEPGVGKSSAIRYFCRQIKSNERVCILKIDSSAVNFEVVTDMFMKLDSSLVDFIVLVIEDIGGTGLDEKVQQVGATLLNFLDGNSECFKVPTLIVATTNYLDCLGGTLTDRPGRFDCVIQCELPSDDEIFFIAESVVKRTLTDDERKALKGTGFTPAYSIESIVRSELYDISIEDSVAQLKDQKEKAKTKDFNKQTKRMGFDQDDY